RNLASQTGRRRRSKPSRTSSTSFAASRALTILPWRSGAPSARRRLPSVPSPNWPATPPRPSRNVARRKPQPRPQRNWCARRRKLSRGKQPSRPRKRQRATRATPRARSENSRRFFRRHEALIVQARRWPGEPAETKTRRRRLVLLHSVVFLHGVLGHRILLHAVFLAHFVLSESGRRERQAERNDGGGNGERDAGVDGH